VEQARTCIQNPDHIEKTQGRGLSGGLIWYFRKSFEGRVIYLAFADQKAARTVELVSGWPILLVDVK
jgi:hypothetical protein